MCIRDSSKTAATNLGTDAGYVNSTLHVGDQVYLNATPGLAAGVYTLLPARYALMTGGFLVTPSTAAPVGSQQLPSVASQVNGYRLSLRHIWMCMRDRRWPGDVSGWHAEGECRGRSGAVRQPDGGLRQILPGHGSA